MKADVSDKRRREFKIRALIGFGLLGVLLVSSIVLLIVQIDGGERARVTSLQNQGYVRYLACVTDIRNEKKVITVSDEISDACWKQAEKEIGMKLPRYSEQVLLENL